MRAFTFPGQGAQAIGMGRDLAAAYRDAAAVFDEVDEALGEKLSALIWDGPIDELTLTANAQPALMATSIAAMRALEAEGVTVEAARFVAGHSLGEYSALCAAGALSVADTARLLRARGRAMRAAVPGGVGAVAHRGEVHCRADAGCTGYRGGLRVAAQLEQAGERPDAGEHRRPVRRPGDRGEAFEEAASRIVVDAGGSVGVRWRAAVGAAHGPRSAEGTLSIHSNSWRSRPPAVSSASLSNCSGTGIGYSPVKQARQNLSFGRPTASISPSTLR